MVLEGIDNQLSILKKVNETHMSYLDILDVQQDEMLDEDSLTFLPSLGSSAVLRRTLSGPENNKGENEWRHMAAVL